MTKITQFQIAIDKLRYINQDLPNRVYERELYEIKIENDKEIIENRIVKKFCFSLCVCFNGMLCYEVW